MSTTDAGTGSFEDRGPSVFAVTTATLVLASVFVAARLYTRLAIVRQVTYDDWFIILAWFLAFGVSFTIDLSTRRGLGRHDSDIGADNWNALRRCEYVFSVLYVSSLPLALLMVSNHSDRILLSWLRRLLFWFSTYACPETPSKFFA